MWTDPNDQLINHIEKTKTLQVESLIIAEWNMNDFQEIENYGTYRHRPNSVSPILVPLTYDSADTASYYTDAERSFFTYSDFVSQNDEPVLFEKEDVDRKLYFDLEECFGPFRPRSGINKLLYFNNKYIDNVKSAKRPRYYMASRYDKFKYWNSYRNQIINNIPTEVGVSVISNPAGKVDGSIVGYYIEDTCPFVVYEKAVPTNRIVVKMQTNLAGSSKGIMPTQSGVLIEDPLANRSQSSIPKRWKIEYLDIENNWVVAETFNETSKRNDGSEVVDWDGYVELSYGIKVPDIYRSSFHLVAYLDDIGNRPPSGANNGEAYVIGMTENFPGTLYIWNAENGNWYSEIARYGFSLFDDKDTAKTGTISSLTDPKYYNSYGKDVFAELVFIKGLRIVVETMIASEQTFNLIELSPRLRADVSNYTVSYELTRSTGNDQSRLPVGGLLASTGQISLMNFDDAFTLNNYNDLSTTQLFENNKGSLVSQYLKQNIKFEFYEIVLNVNGYDKYIPMQSFYSEQFNNPVNGMNELSIPLRDQFFRFETTSAPEILLTDTTITSAIAMILDNCGFSNYVFKGLDDLQDLVNISITANTTYDYPSFYPPIPEGINLPGNPYYNNAINALVSKDDAWNIYWNLANQYAFTPVSKAITVENKRQFYSNIKDPVIPFFYVGPDISTAQALSMLASATQTAMFFDEYNNFVIMPKEYFMPDPNKNERKTDLVLYAQKTGTSLPNVIEINSAEQQIFNDGAIKYSIKYIQKSFSSLSEASYLAEDQRFVYKPVLLWEAGKNQELRAMNDENKQASAYGLTAVGLNTTLTSSAPYVVNNKLQNNVIDVGENVHWIGKFQGYFYANGEIIRYDAVEYKVTRPLSIPTPQSSTELNTVWINSNRDYQKYFASLPFGGKIYPTGNLRIFAEPYYVKYENPNQDATDLDKNVTYKNGPVQRHGRGQFGTEIVEHPAGLPSYWSDNANVRGCVTTDTNKYLFSTTPINKITFPNQGDVTVRVGANNEDAQKTKRNGIIKNWLRRYLPDDGKIKTLVVTESGTVQSSALVFTGPTLSASAVSTKINSIYYVYKELDSAYRHFGTRLRIIGKYERDSDKAQSANNGNSPVSYYSIQPESSSETVTVNGGSGGIAIGINPETNQGYYFEICALTGSNIQQYNQTNSETGDDERVLHNVVFYKIYNNGGKAIPRKLWGGLASIIVDEGNMVGQDRIKSQDNPTVYDLSVEYENLPNGVRRFYLYINNKQIAYVDDSNPLPQYSNMALFIRGESECMFENVYALQSVVSTNSQETAISQISDAFGDDSISTSEGMRKYSVSGFIKPTYLSGIGSNSSPKYKMYFEEFGTILRECAYFNIKYDQAFPALLAIIAPTFNNERGYSVSGFRAGAYGAEFLVFNTTDKAIPLDDSTGYYLRIIGVTFTQQTSADLTVDDYFKRNSSFSDPQRINNIIQSPIIADKIYDNILSSRKKYGKKEFLIESEYIQTEDQANNLMEWVMSKTLRKRLKLSITVFGIPHVQLGDIVSINYIKNNISYVDSTKQFVVQSISHSMASQERSTQLILMEV